MAVIKTDGGYNALPISYKRGNPIPLDTTAVWYDEDALKAYAATGATAYVGQVLTLVDETASTATAYMIVNVSGKLKELGSAPIGDETTIEVDDKGVVSLANTSNLSFTKEIINDDKTTSTVEVKYQPVLTKDGLTWQEPSATTVEGLDLRLTAAEGDVTNLKNRVNTLENKEDKDTTYSVVANDKVLSLSNDNAFSATLGLSYSDKRISLTGINGEEIAGFDASEFVADSVLEDVEYKEDEDGKKLLVFTWNTKDDKGNFKSDIVDISDLIDTYAAGNGIHIDKNAISVKLDDTSETFLSIGANGIKLTGVQEAINEAKTSVSDALDAYKEVANAAISEKAKSSDLDNYYKKSESYSKSETDNKIDEKIASVTGGESAADVKLGLESYRDAVNTEIWGPEAANWTSSTTGEDGKTVVSYNPQYGNKTRIDTLEERVGHDIEGETAATGLFAEVDEAKASAAQGISDAASAASAASAAQSKADQNAQDISNLSDNVSNNYVSKTILDNTLTGYLTSAQIASAYLAKTDADNTYLTKSKAAEIYISKETADATYSTKTTVEAIAAIVDGLKTSKADASTVYTKDDIGVIESGKTLVEMINDVKTAAANADITIKADIQTNAENIGKNSDAIAILNGEATEEGSVKKIADDRIAAALLGADTSFDTLREMSDWLSQHKDSAATMNTAIQNNTAAIAKLNGSETEEGSVLAMIAANAPKIATDTVIGLVLSSSAENKILVNTDGTMEVNSLNVNKLVQTEGEVLILNGGNAKAA